MRYRKLRIAWSVAWGIVAVLSIALLTWSYFATVFLVFDSVVYSVEPRASNLVISRYESRHSMTAAGEPLSLLIGEPIDYELPFWLPTCLFAFIATVPWWSWHFSLRTLLIATTLVAVGLGLIVWLTR